MESISRTCSSVSDRTRPITKEERLCPLVLFAPQLCKVLGEHASFLLMIMIKICWLLLIAASRIAKSVAKGTVLSFVFFCYCYPHKVKVLLKGIGRLPLRSEVGKSRAGGRQGGCLALGYSGLSSSCNCLPFMTGAGAGLL